MVPAVILAAGRSSRFGSPKALAHAGRMSFVSRIVASMQHGGASACFVVIRQSDRALLDEVAGARGFARAVVNPDPDRGQLSSLLTGLEAADAPGVDAVLVTLVDMPLVSPGTVRQLLDRAARSSALVVRAAHRGHHGHPVIFKRAAFDALRRADPAVGAKAVVHALGAEDVEVDDPGVLEDVDTPEDYDRLFGRE